MSRTWVWLWFCCLAWQLGQGYAADLPAARFSRPVSWQPSDTATLLAVAFDPAVYAASRDDFGDLRLLDQDGVETPFLLQKIANRKTIVQRVASRIENPSLQKVGEDGVIISLVLAKDAANIDGLSIVTGQRNFEYNLQIQGSVDGKQWQTLVDKALIYDYSQTLAVENRDIALPANQDRFFKLVVAKASQTRAAELLELTRTLSNGQEQSRNEKQQIQQQALHIEQIEAWHVQEQTLPESPQQFDYPLSAFKVSQDADHKTSLIDIDSPRLPLTGIKLQISTANFSRSAEVQIQRQHGVESRLQVMANAQLQAVHFQDINRENTELVFPEQRGEHYRIVVQNQDNPPLAITRVSGVGNAYQLVFLPQADHSYRLSYGNEQLAQPVYDTAAIQELLVKGYPLTAADLGAESATAQRTAKLDAGRFLHSNLLLGVIIGLMVVVLVWSLYRVGRRVGDMPE